MKAWVSRRRDDGAVLSEVLPVIDGASLFDLVVVEVTQSGNRRPAKVARLRPVGDQRTLAQLLMPKLVKFVGWTLVLSGIEERKDEAKQIKGVAQTWICKLRPPPNALGFRVKDTHRGGVALPKGAVRDSSGTPGRLLVASEFAKSLQRHSVCAELQYYQPATFPAARLVDCYVEWMSDETFELGGLQIREEFQGQPQRLERNGWLCGIDIEEPALTKREARMLR